MRRPASRRGRGVTLIEAVLYIAIALALIVGGLVFYQQAVTAYRVNAAVRSLSALVVEARIIATQNKELHLSDVEMERVLLAQGSVPADVIDMTRPETYRIRTPWGSRVFMQLQDLAGSATVFVDLEAIPVAACARLTTSDASGKSIFTTNIRATWIRDVEGQFFTLIGRGFNPRQAGTSCKNRDDDGDGLVSVQFQLPFVD